MRDYGNCLHFRSVFPCSRSRISLPNPPVFHNLAPSFAPAVTRHGARRERRPDGGANRFATARVPSSRGKGVEAKRRNAGKGGGVTATKCEIMGNRKARRRGGAVAPSTPPASRCETPPRPARHPDSLPIVPASPPFPLSRLRPFCLAFAPPVSPLVPPLLSDFWPPFRPSPRLKDGGSRRRGHFRARLRKLLAFSLRFSVLSQPNFATKSPRFP